MFVKIKRKRILEIDFQTVTDQILKNKLTHEGVQAWVSYGQRFQKKCTNIYIKQFCLIWLSW